MISAAVTDGVTVGHPCCSQHECKVPLRKTTDEYCPAHDHMRSNCCVTNCSKKRDSGFKTCAIPTHRKEETYRTDLAKNKKKRLRPNQGREADEYEADDNEGTDLETDRFEKGRRREKVKGVFSRKWTHNEQLMVRPCGMVIGRATFYSSESMTAVRVS